jgi:hypothetical protein
MEPISMLTPSPLGAPFPSAGDSPKTVTEAVDMLLSLVPEPDRTATAEAACADMLSLNFSVGTWVRHNLRLSDGNDALLADTGARGPERAAKVIVRAFGQKMLERGEAAY